MSFQFRTILELEGDITYRYSIAGVTGRHGTGAAGRVRQLINVSIQEFREMVAMAADGAYLVGTPPASLPTSAAVTGETYAEVDWPLDAIGVYGVRVQLTSSGRWYPLKRIPFAAYQDYQLSSLVDLSGQKDPIGYTSRHLPQYTAAAEAVGKVMIVPVPTRGSYRLWYLQAWAPLAADGDKFYGIAEGQEWIILNTCIKMLQPDNDSQKAYSMWTQQLKRVEDRITARAQKLESGMAIEPRNARNDGYNYDRYDDL